MLKRVISPATAADPSDSSESSSDGGSTALLSWERYKAAEIAGGLLRKRDFLRATRELTAILSRHVNYAALAPALQTALLEDCHLAVEQCDRSSLQRRIVSGLMRAASRAFPRSKGSRLARAWKAQSIDLARRAKRESLQLPDAVGCSLATVLPAEVLEAILSQLQPVSLGSAAAVCREWHAAVGNDALWRRFLPVHIRDDGQTYRQQFLARVADGSPAVRGYYSRRVFISDGLQWTNPEEACKHERCYPSIDEAVGWILGHPPGLADSSNTDGD